MQRNIYHVKSYFWGKNNPWFLEMNIEAVKSRMQKLFILCCFTQKKNKCTKRHKHKSTVFLKSCCAHQYINTKNFHLLIAWNVSKWCTFNQHLLTTTFILFQALVKFVSISNPVLKLWWQSHHHPQLESLILQRSLKIGSLILENGLWPLLPPVIFFSNCTFQYKFCFPCQIAVVFVVSFLFLKPGECGKLYIKWSEIILDTQILMITISTIIEILK